MKEWKDSQNKRQFVAMRELLMRANGTWLPDVYKYVPPLDPYTIKKKEV